MTETPARLRPRAYRDGWADAVQHLRTLLDKPRESEPHCLACAIDLVAFAGMVASFDDPTAASDPDTLDQGVDIADSLLAAARDDYLAGWLPTAALASFIAMPDGTAEATAMLALMTSRMLRGDPPEGTGSHQSSQQLPGDHQ